jgi:hypothetical protein
MVKSSEYRIRRALLGAGAAFLALGVLIRPLAAAPQDEVRAMFERFVTAQNDHDAKAVQALLLDSPSFLWITRGTPIWGVDAAMKRFATLYQGTWRLEPESADLKVIMLGEGVAQLYVPVMFTIGPAGHSAQPTRFLINQLLVKTASGWKVSSILPIPSPTQ